ncbi:DUF6081 family protein [Hyalangium sp.]|uniref:DUF6081 family protein n=1 Tax=Hyalangium sp. TaxID=2028555 RepID=UPI002D48DCB3|nr:DUF6081 family protein [Hyalangium sp.]HYH95013.1 DUF6081 family protein [Hyalangium sp.]
MSERESSAGSTQAPYQTVWDRFDNGFSVGTPDARWGYYAAGSFVTNDSITTTSPAGLRVVPKGKNPATGEPAFTLTVSPEQDASGLPGWNDHVKFLVYANHLASTGLPGFDAVRGQELVFETWMSGQTFGTQAHPFGSWVRDPEDDLRLATIGHNVIDVGTGMVFDFLLTNKRVYALYERLTFARTPQKHYAAFTYAIPVAQRTPSTLHHMKITYDRAAGVARWLLEDKEVFRVNRIGRRIDPQWLVIDGGGEEEDLELRQLNGGMGLLTLLDAVESGRSLVRLCGAPGFYNPPPSGAKHEFLDEKSLPGSRLFGQGAELRMQRFVISSTPV